MQLSQKQKAFSGTFSAFLKSRLNLENTYIKRRIHSSLMYFPNYRLLKTWLDKYQKSSASEYPWTRDMANLTKHCWNWTAARLLYLLILVKATEFEKIPLSYMQNLKTVCEQIHCLWQVVCS